MDLLGFTWIFIYFSFLGKRSSNPLYPDYVPTILVQTTPKQEFKRVEKLKRDSQKLDSDIKNEKSNDQNVKFKTIFSVSYAIMQLLKIGKKKVRVSFLSFC